MALAPVDPSKHDNLQCVMQAGAKHARARLSGAASSTLKMPRFRFTFKNTTIDCMSQHENAPMRHSGMQECARYKPYKYAPLGQFRCRQLTDATPLPLCPVLVEESATVRGHCHRRQGPLRRVLNMGDTTPHQDRARMRTPAFAVGLARAFCLLCVHKGGDRSCDGDRC